MIRELVDIGKFSEDNWDNWDIGPKLTGIMIDFK